MKRILIVILPLMFIACKHDLKTIDAYMDGDTICINEDLVKELSVAELRQRFIDTGNPIYYNYSNTGVHERELLYHMIDANKYNDSIANYMYYMLFSNYFPINEDFILKADSLDEISREQVMSRLMIAAKTGNVFANTTLAMHYRHGSGVEINNDKADSLVKSRYHSGKNINTKANKKNVYSFLNEKIKLISTNRLKKEDEKVCWTTGPEFGDYEDYRKVCSSGNIDAYNRIKSYYKSKGVERETIFFSIVMANKYNYGPACFDVYNCLWQAFNGGKEAEAWDMTRFDPKSREFALFYLKSGASLRNKACEEILLKQF